MLASVSPSGGEAIEFNSAFSDAFGAGTSPPEGEELAFFTKDNPFAGLKGM